MLGFLVLGVGLLEANPGSGPAVGGPVAGRVATPWSRVDFDGVRVPCLPGGELELCLYPDVRTITTTGPDQHKEVRRMPTRLRFQFSLTPNGADTTAFNDSSRWKVRLHYPDGRVLEPEQVWGPDAVSSGVITLGRGYIFPLGDNSLTEAWLELHLGENTYWYEIPYGFTRDPDAPVPPSDAKAEQAGYVPAMKVSPAATSQIVRWSKVNYSLGTLPDGATLQADLKNGGDLTCLLRFRHAGYEWEFHRPIATVKVIPDTAAPIAGWQFAERIDPGIPSNREDEFRFRFPSLHGRGWATLEVRVDEQPVTATISLGTFLPGMWVDPWGK